MSDVNWSSVSLLLRCNGSNGSTTFTDDSSAGRAITVVGDAQITTTNPRWGTGAALFDGAGDRLTAAYASGLHLSTGDFTIECWVRVNTASTAYTLLSFCTAGASTEAWTLAVNTNNAPTFAARDDVGNYVALIVGSSGLVTANTWAHVAVTRSGNSFRLFWNGTQTGSTGTNSGAIRPTAGTYVLAIGAHNNNTSVLNGRLDDIRITAGVARYTANFTAPTAELPVGPPPLEALVQGRSPLGSAQVLARQQYARVQGGSPLGRGQVLAQIVNAWVQGRSPLGSGQAVAWQQHARLQGRSPLGTASAVARVQFAQLQGRGPLGRGQVQIIVPLAAQVRGRSPLGTARVVTWHDFTGGVAGSVLQYVCDLITPTGTVRVPISSWQATLQTDEASYAQVVIPALLDYVQAAADATEFVISRRARLALGGAIEYAMVRAPIDTRSFAQGTANYTGTLSGYFDALAMSAGPAALDRTLTAVRTVTEGDGGLRIRCDVDWLLRPGMRAVNGATTFTVGWINYYVLGDDQYMDVGEAI